MGDGSGRLPDFYRRVRGALSPVRRSWSTFRRRHATNHEFVHPGHFYSAVPSVQDRQRYAPPDADRCLDVGGVDLRVDAQWQLASRLAELQISERFGTGAPPFRYNFDNPSFAASDGLFLHLMLRDAKPRRLVEIGSGHSSVCVMDTSEHFLETPIDCVLIDPEPELVTSLTVGRLDEKTRIIGERVQDIDIEVFDALDAGDFLFVDSSHVSKLGSDVNYILFDILPRLRPGVIVHFHDIFPGFEYPKGWVDEGRSWNECYALRAFLQFNTEYRVLLWPALLWMIDEAAMAEMFPDGRRNAGGSIYLVRSGGSAPRTSGGTA